MITEWENVDGNPETYNTHTKINTNNTPKQNEYRSKQWKKPDREQKSPKSCSHKVATVTKDNTDDENGPKNE